MTSEIIQIGSDTYDGLYMTVGERVDRVSVRSKVDGRVLRVIEGVAPVGQVQTAHSGGFGPRLGAIVSGERRDAYRISRPKKGEEGCTICTTE